MVNRLPDDATLHPIGFKVPGWMLDAIDRVQASHRLVTRTEAARLVIVKGLDALGVEQSGATDGGAA